MRLAFGNQIARLMHNRATSLVGAGGEIADLHYLDNLFA